MKDIYELLNDIDMDIDEDDFNEIEVNDIEKARVKNNLRRSIESKYNWRRQGIAVAVVAIISTMVLGLSFPAYAKNIPIVGNIFRLIDDSVSGVYYNYKENTSEINVTKESKGVNITINDAVFDGTNISLTYTIESDIDLELGDEIYLNNEISINEDLRTGMSGTSKFVKVDNKTYVGQENLTVNNFIDNPRDKINIELRVKKLVAIDGNSEPIKGKWDFNIELNAVNGEIKTINKAIEKDGITATIGEVKINPMSTFISYSQKVSNDIIEKWDDIILDIEVKDNLGNVYLGTNNGATSDEYFNYNSSNLYGKISEEATKLIITPKAMLKLYGQVEYVEQEARDNITGEKYTGLAETYGCAKLEEVILDDIIIELE